MSDVKHICQHEGCTSDDTTPCYLPDTRFNAAPDYYFCYAHAHDEGFCPCCGAFWAGNERFDFRVNKTEFCENCYETLQDELGENDDVDDGWDYYPEWSDIIEGEEGGRYIGEGSEYEGGDE